ncbi:hypothetical protein [Flavihumibacter petaseus]|uniref:Lipoprotein n=1 Tax=Flavihumibacter petaseus NBRC 106054 TaxID=1220578 RepID=A0A0E9MXV4_9BACT|nr:hypothetical protein [Flavihumibacter petaseus]GAO42409.1 hypothetical protein FPE01S_01_14240 [Flavihumibacter petaseus NBRC 106054]
MKRIFLVAAILSGLAACNNAADDGAAERKDGYSAQPASVEDSLFQQVMDGHDVAMGKMGKVKGYEDRVAKALDSLDKVKGTGNDAVKAQYKELQQDLKQAASGMDTWMEEFNPDSSKDSKDARLKYLQSEVDKVTKVKQDILSSLEKADLLFPKN